MISALALVASLAAPTFALPPQEPATAPAASTPETPEQVAREARRAERLAARRALLPTLFEGHLVDAGDGQDFAETTGYWRLLEMLDAYPLEELRRRLAPGFDYDEFMAEPDLWRGELVRIRALFVDAWAVRLQRPIGGREDVWRGLISETDGSEGILFDMLDRPPDALVDERSVVDIEGLVYRTVRYESRTGKIAEAPYLLVRSIAIVDTEVAHKRGVADQYFAALIGAAAVFFVGRILWTMRGRMKGTPRPRPPDFNEMFERAARAGARPPKSDAKH